jgi:hypothetical protein
MTIRRALLAASLFAVTCISGHAAIITVALDSGSFQIFNQLTTALTAGSGIDGDGAVLQLGYYDQATAGNNFLGVWVSLTGEGSLNTGGVVLDTDNEPFNKTSIGDAALDGAGAGTFAITVTFDTANSGTNNSFPSMAGIPLAIKFYNNTTIGSSTFYNVVSNSNWGWVLPGLPQDNAHVKHVVGRP